MLHYDPIGAISRNRAYLLSLTPYYHPVCTVEDVDHAGAIRFTDHDGVVRQYDRVLSRTLLSTPIVVARLDGQIVAMDGVCPHRSADLGDGYVSSDGCAVVCPNHGFGWRGSDGRICSIPALEAIGKPLPTGEGWKVKTYPVKVKYGLVWVALTPTSFPILEIIEYDDPTFTHCPVIVSDWNAGIGRMLDQADDNYHFAFAHRRTIGDPSHPEAPVAKTELTDNYVYATYTILQPVNATFVGMGSVGADGLGQGLAPVLYEQWTNTNTTYLRKTGPEGKFIIVFACCPIGPQLTRFWRLNLFNYPQDIGTIVALENTINAEDEHIVTKMRPWTLTTDLDAELQLVIDRPTVKLREWLHNKGIVYL